MEKKKNVKKETDNKMIIAMSCTKNWYHYLVVNLYSLLECTKAIEKIYLFVETKNVNDIPYLKDLIKKYKVKIELINISKHLDKYLSPDCPNLNTIYSNFCFTRLLLSDFVKEDKVLYIDTDAIVIRDISNIWKYDISEYYVAGVKDYGVILDGSIYTIDIQGKYINSGFVLFNLKLIREDDIQSKWFDIINSTKLTYPDQEALNLVCQYKTLYISSMYNSCEYACDRVTTDTVNMDLLKVIHFVGPKDPWVADRHFGEYWYDAEERFYNEFGWYKYE